MSEEDKIADLTNHLTSSFNSSQASYKADLKIYPDVKMIKIGGQSITDRGRSAMFPILEEIVENKEKYQIMISSGGVSRDDDLPTPLLFSYDVYELSTTPLTV